MAKPGDCVTLDFAGAQGVKRRPGVIVSSDLYHRERPDVVVGLLTTNINAATASTKLVAGIEQVKRGHVIPVAELRRDLDSRRNR